MSCLVLELGAIAVKSRLEGSREEAENLSLEELQKLVYDKYDVQLRGLTVSEWTVGVRVGLVRVP